MSDPSDDRIRERAYEIWTAKGRPADKDVDNWLEAERELGTEPIDGPVAEETPGPDETVETIGESPDESIVTLTHPAPEPADAES